MIVSKSAWAPSRRRLHESQIDQLVMISDAREQIYHRNIRRLMKQVV
jgi:hypothetical protein